MLHKKYIPHVFDPIEEVINWNKERNLLNEFNLEKEASFIMEELLESLGYNKTFESKEEFRRFCIFSVSNANCNNTNIKEQIDAFIDLLIFSIGAIAKGCNTLKIDPKEAIYNVCLANDKKGNKVDSGGKIIKDENFTEPELPLAKEEEE